MPILDAQSLKLKENNNSGCRIMYTTRNDKV